MTSKQVDTQDKEIAEETRPKTSTALRPFDHILKYIGVFGGVQGLSMLVSVIRNKLTTVLLGQVGFALITIYNNICEFVTSTSNFGIPFSAVRHVSELNELGQEKATTRFVCVVRTWCVWTALLAVALLTVFSPCLAHIFSDDDTQLTPVTIILLAPTVVCMTISGGELSILKGTHHLKRIATISAIGAVSTLICTIPFYWLWRINGIIIALDFSTLMYVIINLSFSLPIFPWHISLMSRQVLREGWDMIRLGIPYVLAAVAGSGVGLALPALFVHFGQIEDVGLYRAAFVVMSSYAGIVFTALEADYFPRLSSVNHDVHRRNFTIDQQVRVCVLLIAPLLLLMMLFMPLIVEILFVPDFHLVVPMAICAGMYTFCRAISLPMSYTALACGDSVLYLCMEIIYDVASLAIIAGCYYLWGPVGAGIGLSLAGLFDLLLIWTCYGIFYHIRLKYDTILLAIEQAFLMIAMILTCMLLPTAVKLCTATLLIILSTILSWRVLRRESHFIARLKQRTQPERS